MSVSKKDFIVVAEIIKEAKEKCRGDTPVEYILNFIEMQLTNYFEAENSMFDRDRFIKACELEIKNAEKM